MELFYGDLEEKRKGKLMRLKTDLEFQQSEIKNLNKKYNVQMFSTKVRGSKAFAAEQKIKELKKLLLKSKNNDKKNKIKINPNKLITLATNNMNKTPTEKYNIEPETVEKNSLINDNFHRLSRVNIEFNRRVRFNEKV